MSSAILQSDDLDEVDWEWLGGSAYGGKVQSNYFGKGNTTSYDRAVWTDVSDTQTKTRNYTISWTKEAVVWYIDGAVIRTLAYKDALSGENFPQTPMDVRIGIWAGGDPANDEGTVEWAGGETDYEAGPYTMLLERVEVVNENPGASYSYGDLSGAYESIVVNDAEGGGESGSSSSSSASKAEASKTSGTESKAKGTAAGATASATQMDLLSSASASASAAPEEVATSRASAVSIGFLQKVMLSVLLLALAAQHS